MKTTRMPRRAMLNRLALSTASAVVPALFGGDPAPKTRQGFKIGAVDWELTEANDPGAFEVAARLGFDGLQVDLGSVSPMRAPARQKLFLDRARAHQVEIASLAMGILSEVPYARDHRAVELVDQAIDIARAMGQRIILLAFFGSNDLQKPENRTETLVRHLRENAPKAEKAGVVLALEAEISVDRYREILDKAGSPAVQVYFDLVHAHTAGRDFYEEITSLKERIAEFHAKDYGNILFGQGNVDFKAVRRGMDAIGYRGWLLVEQWGEIRGDKHLGFDETHRRNLRYLREVFPKEA